MIKSSSEAIETTIDEQALAKITREIAQSGGIMSKESFKSLISCKTIKHSVINELESYQDELAHSLDASSFK